MVWWEALLMFLGLVAVVVVAAVVGVLGVLALVCRCGADGTGQVVARPSLARLPWRRVVGAYERLLNGLNALRDLVLPPEMKVVEMVHAHWQTQALYAVTRLGVPDVIPLRFPTTGSTRMTSSTCWCSC